MLRRDLAALEGASPRLIKALEEQSNQVEEVVAASGAAVAATEALQDATVLVLSGNTSFTNERVLKASNGLKSVDAGSELRLTVDATVTRATDGAVTLVAPGDGSWFLPFPGYLVTRSSSDTLSNKTLDKPKAVLIAAADDAAASTAGVPLGGLYEASGVVRIRKV